MNTALFNDTSEDFQREAEVWRLRANRKDQEFNELIRESNDPNMKLVLTEYKQLARVRAEDYIRTFPEAASGQNVAEAKRLLHRDV